MGCNCGGKKKKAALAAGVSPTARVRDVKPKRPAVWNGKPKETET